jgi:hypothetical protein
MISKVSILLKDHVTNGKVSPILPNLRAISGIFLRTESDLLWGEV